MYRLIWAIFGKGLVNHLRKAENNPVTHRELEYAFTDPNNLKYYRFPTSTGMPLKRFGKLQEFLMWLSSGLTNEQLEELIGAAEKTLEAGVVKVENGKRMNLIKIASILQEIKSRSEIVKPAELVLNVVAVQLVREDENPGSFNNAIHMEKVTTFLEESNNEDSFFFQMPELTKLFNLTTMSKEGWGQYLTESIETQKRLKEALRTYS